MGQEKETSGGAVGCLIVLVLTMCLLAPLLVLCIVVVWLVAESSVPDVRLCSRLSSGEYVRIKQILDYQLRRRGIFGRAVDLEEVRELIYEECATEGLREAFEGPAQRQLAWQSAYRWLWGSRVAVGTCVLLGILAVYWVNEIYPSIAEVYSGQDASTWVITLAVSGLLCWFVGLIGWFVGALVYVALGLRQGVPLERWELLVQAVEEFEGLNTKV